MKFHINCYGVLIYYRHPLYHLIPCTMLQIDYFSLFSFPFLALLARSHRIRNDIVTVKTYLYIFRVSLIRS